MKTNPIPLERRVMEKNDEAALANRSRLDSAGIYAINMISSPGSGKTTLLEKLLPELSKSLRCGVIEGDVQTERDAIRIAALGVPVRQIITCGACHLDARMVADHLEALPLDSLDLVFFENVGNLVCPSAYWLGEDCKMALLSVAEGDDKPIKYPAVFRRADVLVLNKTDLLPYTDFSLEKAVGYARGIRPDIAIFPVSCRTGDGLAALAGWIRARCADKRRPPA